MHNISCLLLHGNDVTSRAQLRALIVPGTVCFIISGTGRFRFWQLAAGLESGKEFVRFGTRFGSQDRRQQRVERLRRARQRRRRRYGNGSEIATRTAAAAANSAIRVWPSRAGHTQWKRTTTRQLPHTHAGRGREQAVRHMTARVQTPFRSSSHL